MCLEYYRFCPYNNDILTSNIMNILKVRKVHGNKISKLCSDNSYYESVTSHNSEKVLFNFSNHSSTEHEKSLLSRELNFALPPKNVSFIDYLLPLGTYYLGTLICVRFLITTKNLCIVG